MIAVVDFQEGPTLNKKAKSTKKIYRIVQHILNVKVLLKVLVTIEFMLTKYLVKVLLKRFYLNAHTLGFYHRLKRIELDTK